MGELSPAARSEGDQCWSLLLFLELRRSRVIGRQVQGARPPRAGERLLSAQAYGNLDAAQQLSHTPSGGPGLSRGCRGGQEEGHRAKHRSTAPTPRVSSRGCRRAQARCCPALGPGVPLTHLQLWLGPGLARQWNGGRHVARVSPAHCPPRTAGRNAGQGLRPVLAFLLHFQTLGLGSQLQS